MLDAHISRMPNFYDNSAIHFSFPTFNYYAFVLYWPECSETPIKIRSDIESTSEYFIHACHAASTLEQGKGKKIALWRQWNGTLIPLVLLFYSCCFVELWLDDEQSERPFPQSITSNQFPCNRCAHWLRWHLFATFSNVNTTHWRYSPKMCYWTAKHRTRFGRWNSHSAHTYIQAINIHTFGFGTRSASHAGYYVGVALTMPEKLHTHVMDHGGDGVVSRCIYVVNMHVISGRICTATKVSTSNWMIMWIAYFECKQWNRLSVIQIWRQFKLPHTHTFLSVLLELPYAIRLNSRMSSMSIETVTQLLHRARQK